MKHVIIIGAVRVNKQVIVEAASRAMKTDIAVASVIHYLSSCTNVRFEEVEESSKRFNDSFTYLGTTTVNAKKAFEDFIESMKDCKTKNTFVPEPSKFMSKPKNNFRTR